MSEAKNQKNLGGWEGYPSPHPYPKGGKGGTLPPRRFVWTAFGARTPYNPVPPRQSSCPSVSFRLAIGPCRGHRVPSNDTADGAGLPTQQGPVCRASPPLPLLYEISFAHYLRDSPDQLNTFRRLLSKYSLHTTRATFPVNWRYLYSRLRPTFEFGVRWSLDIKFFFLNLPHL